MTTTRIRLGTVLPILALVLLAPSRPALGQNLAAAVAAADLAITPESLVIAGFTTTEAATILTRIEDAQGLRDLLHSRRLQAQEAMVAMAALSRLLQLDSDNALLASQYEAAQQELQTINTQIQQVRQSLFAIVTDGFPAQKAQKLIVWRKAARYRVAPEFRVTERTAQQWRAVQRALRAEARANRLGRDLAEGHAQLLTQVRSDPAVTQAANNLTANLDAMKALFAEFFG